MLQRVASPMVAVLLALFVSTSFVDPDDGSRQVDSPDFAPWIDTSDRETVLQAFNDTFGRNVPTMEWTGNVGGCIAGDSSDALRRETVIRIEYYRAMAGVPAAITEDPVLSDKAQAAALMMSAEGRLTHHPDGDFACFSQRGQEAAANSNLYLGRTGPRAIDGYIEDPGDDNVDVGHRSTILHPPTEMMGIGHVAGSSDRYPANALWVFDDGVFVKDYQTREPARFVAWPPRGFVPSAVVYPRWSFALQEADFSGADVSMTDENGLDVEVDVVIRLSKDGEIPSSVIVWEPAIDLDDAGGDLGFTVTISNVVAPPDRPRGQVDSIAATPRLPHSEHNATVTDYSYRVVVVDQDQGPSLLEGLWSPISDAASSVAEAGRVDGE